MNNNDYYCIVTPLLSIDNSQKKQGSVVLWTSEIQGAQHYDFYEKNVDFLVAQAQK